MSKLLLILTILLTTTIAAADQQSHNDAAKEMLELMDADRVIEATHEQMHTHLSAIMVEITGETQPSFDVHLEKMVEVMKEEMNWDKMEPYMVAAYVSVYSEEEFKGTRRVLRLAAR